LFVAFEPRNDVTLELAQEVKTKEHSQESRFGGENYRRQK